MAPPTPPVKIGPGHPKGPGQVATGRSGNNIEGMARGWESKSVENQVQDSAVPLDAPRSGRMTPEEMLIQKKRDALQLSRAHVMQDLKTSTNPRYRSYLQEALTHLDAEIARLEKGGH